MRKFGDALDDVAETAEGERPSLSTIDNAGDASQRCETLYAGVKAPLTARLWVVKTAGQSRTRDWTENPPRERLSGPGGFLRD